MDFSLDSFSHSFYFNGQMMRTILNRMFPEVFARLSRLKFRFLCPQKCSLLSGPKSWRDLYAGHLKDFHFRYIYAFSNGKYRSRLDQRNITRSMLGVVLSTPNRAKAKSRPCVSLLTGSCSIFDSKILKIASFAVV